MSHENNFPNQNQETEIIYPFKIRNNLKILETLGSGHYGTVYKVLDTNSNELSAIKVYKPRDIFEGISVTTLREVALLKSLNHENIIKIKKVYSDVRELELELEYCDTDLYKLQQQAYSLNAIKSIMFQLLLGVKELHSNRILHRDLKTPNIFIQGNTVKIGDFGLSRVYSIPGKPYSREVMTVCYRPPEILLGFDNYSTSSDVWSIGCIFGELLCKDLLFPFTDDISMVRNLVAIFGNFVQNENLMPGVRFFESVRRLFGYLNYPDIFIGLRQFIMQRTKFPISDAMFDLLNRMLKINPNERISCKEALEHPFFKN